MSLAHIRFIQHPQSNSDAIEYRVESPDFNSMREWEKVGDLKIDCQNKKYIFIASDIWLKNKVVPPEIFSLNEPEREKIIEEKFQAYGFGAWSGIIHHYASGFIAENKFPEHYPPVFFKNEITV
jgi:hypothetical protein